MTDNYGLTRTLTAELSLLKGSTKFGEEN